MTGKIKKYTGLVIQPHVKVAETRDEIMINLDRVCKMIDFGVGYNWELPARLVVLPEYFLQGVTTPGKGEHGLEEFMKKAITIPGPEIEILAKKAKQYGIYISGGGVVEQLPEFPDRWFNAAFIIGPDGDVILKYHKWHVPAFIGLGTSPHDMIDEYAKHYGGDLKSRFPVVDTEIGKLGTMTCHDGATPEIARALGFNGAEVICHPTAQQEFEGVSEPWDFWTFTRRARAHDNMCYILGSNWGSVEYDYYPHAFCAGNSFIIDYIGNLVRRAPYPAEQVIGAPIDIEALREHRSRISHNTWVDVRAEIFKEMYEAPIYPANLFPVGRPPRSLTEKINGAKAALKTLYERGTFTPPDGLSVADMADELDRRVDYAHSIGTLRKID
ncbi:nitrilase-related carbon-nitrogen hydrolase [Sphingomonas flavalba]|uniref:nitrilase-related carbon-nitrogen hydrolase n=1 Tax=Sphingomonas flavalba TaxID=2559804 RepID=UPI00109D91E7|nr:nitrilase-related carbon-nitrogen hydrolase [Sphingomonas flavalba]